MMAFREAFLLGSPPPRLCFPSCHCGLDPQHLTMGAEHPPRMAPKLSPKPGWLVSALQIPSYSSRALPTPWHTCTWAHMPQSLQGTAIQRKLPCTRLGAPNCWMWGKYLRKGASKRNSRREDSHPPRAGSHQCQSRDGLSEGPPAGSLRRESRLHTMVSAVLPFLSFFSSSSPPAPSKVKMMPVWEFTPTAVTTILPEPSMT